MVGDTKSRKKKNTSEIRDEPEGKTAATQKTKVTSKARNAVNKKAAEPKVKVQENGKPAGRPRGNKRGASPSSEENEEPMKVDNDNTRMDTPTIANKKARKPADSDKQAGPNSGVNADSKVTRTAVRKEKVNELMAKSAPTKHGRPAKVATVQSDLGGKEVVEVMETNNNNTVKKNKELTKKRNGKGASLNADNPHDSEDISDPTVEDGKIEAESNNGKLPVKMSRRVNGGKNALDDNPAEPPKKKARIVEVTHASHGRRPGVVLVVGEGDTGQLGLGPDVMDRAKPGPVTGLPENVVQVCAGGMHSVCLTADGEVYTYGCNDEGALGRITADDDETYVPGRVEFDEKIVQVSAGDSHTAALTHTGMVYICGTFRDCNGPIGILVGEGKIEKPVHIMKEHVVVKIASGCDHLVCLTNQGDIYTLGCADQGQLGRVAECFSVRGGRKGLGMLLTPGIVHCKKRSQKFSNVWTGQYITFAKASNTGEIYAWGLNNYFQLGFPDMLNKFVPEKSKLFDSRMDWAEISGGQHHTVALDGDGFVYSLGRKEYGRLGLGSDDLTEKSAPTLIPALQGKKCVNVDCGTAVSFAVAEDGTIYGWGMGSSKQLGQGDNEDDVYEPTPIAGKLQNKKGLTVSAGGQHTIFLVQS